MMKKASLLAVLSCFIPVLLLSGCSRKNSLAGKAGAKVVVLDNGAEPEYIDPSLTSGTYGGEVLVQLFEGLTAYDPKTLEPVPGVAKSWKVSPNAKVYTFSLRDDAKWSDGAPVTAHDFVFSWQRIVDPKTASKYAYILYFVKNAEAINAGKITDPAKLGVKAIDDHTLRVELENPTPFFLKLTCFYTYAPLRRDVIEKYGDHWTRSEHMVGNGPFKLVAWNPSEKIVIEPNPHYWDRHAVKINRAIFLPLEDRETALKMYLNGEMHRLWEVPSLRVPSVKDRDDFHTSPELSTYHLFLNTTHKHFADKRVRQAFAHAIDRKQLVTVLNMGIARAAFVPEGIKGYVSPQGLEFDPQKAKKLLAEAGFADPKTFPKTTFYYNTNTLNRTIAEVVQNMWKQHLGIDIEILNMEWKSLQKNWKSKAYDISRVTWVGDYVDPNTFLDMYLSKSGNNHTFWKNQRYDALIGKAAETINPIKRFATLQEAETLLLTEAPIIPLFTYTRPIMMSSRLIGYHPNLQDIHPLKGVELK